MCSEYCGIMDRPTAFDIRVSSKDQRTDSQIRDLRCYCQQRSWKRSKFFIDKITGAKSSRPEHDRMVTVTELRAGRLEQVVTFKLDRPDRSIMHLCLLVDELTRLGVPLICTSQGMDTSRNNPAGKFQLEVLKAVCEFERNLIRDQINSGLAAAKERGVRLGQPPPPRPACPQDHDPSGQRFGHPGDCQEVGMVGQLCSLRYPCSTAAPTQKASPSPAG